MDPWRLQLLGGVRAGRADATIERFPTRKTAALLAWLALEPARPQPREALAERFWPGATPAAGRNSLSQALSTLRRLLEAGAEGGAVLEADRDSVALADGALITDVADFEAAIARAQGHAPASEERRAALADALDRYAGELMPAHYDDWVLQRREILADLHRWALSSAVGDLIATGSADEAIRLARLSVTADPLSEPARRDLIRALLAAERPGEAMAQFRGLEAMLDTEFGVQPSAESRALIDGLPAAGAPAEAAAPSEVAWSGTATCVVVRAPEVLPADVAAEHVRTLAKLAHDFRARVLQPGARETILMLRHAGDGIALATELRRFARVPVRVGLDTGELRDTPAGGPSAPPPAARAAAIAALVRPGRIVMTQATMLLGRSAIEDEERVVPLGRFALAEPEAGRTGGEGEGEAVSGRKEALFELRPGQAGDESAGGGGGAGAESEIEAGARGRGGDSGGGGALDAAVLPATSVPVRRDRMVGRDAERARLLGLLADEGVRLVTITGMGGTGKSRLATSVAAEREAAGSGRVVWVELAGLDDPAEVGRAIAEAVGVPPGGLARPIEGVAVELGGETGALLILDNLEQLLPDAAGTVVDVLDACPEVVCLCTSRRRLGLAGERDFALAPLPVPDIDALERQVRDNPSVELFVDRVRALQPDYELGATALLDIARLCAAIEGVPLAIELAAARAAVLSPRQMVERIEDRLRWLADERADLTERQRSLRGAIDWSYELLTPAQRRAFAHCSVFRGSWDIEAAEAILDDPLVIDRLAELRDASLLSTRVSGGVVRYGMLEMLREFAAERLEVEGGSWGVDVGLGPGVDVGARGGDGGGEGAGEGGGEGERSGSGPEAAAALRARHAAYYAALADRAKHALTGPEQGLWLERLSADDDNLRAAAAWCASETGDVRTGLTLALGLQYYWYTRGHWRRGLEEIGALLARPGADADPVLHAKVARVAGGLATHLDRFEEATRYLELALAAQRRGGDRYGELVVMVQLAVLANRIEDYERSLALAQECAAGFRQLEDEKAQRGLSAVLNLIGLAYRALGDPAAARPHLEEALALIRASGDVRAMSDIIENVAQLELAEGRLPEAHALLVESLEHSAAVDSRWSMLRTMTTLAAVHAAAGDKDRAVRCHGAIDALESRLGQRQEGSLLAERAAVHAALRAELGAEVFEAQWQAGAAMGWAEVVAEAGAKVEVRGSREGTCGPDSGTGEGGERRKRP